MARIVDPSRHAYCVKPSSTAGLLIDAEDYYRAFYQAACAARRSILLSGWQFDRNVELLRGSEAERAEHPVTLLKFLNSLCERSPELQIWILAWDFHLVLAAEREWMQKVLFHWMTNERLRFRFDDNHVARGCHHQKFAIIDGQHSFLGGMDLCDHRWDSRAHEAKNPLRMSRGAPHQPFHDIQIYLGGTEIAGCLSELFSCRWERSGGEPLPTLIREPPHERVRLEPHNLLTLPTEQVVISRTDPNASPSGPTPCAEIRTLYVDAIRAAERLIYLETQYFSSHDIADAFEQRMRDESRSKLEIVMILNKRGETLKEQAAVGLAQAQILGRLKQVARECGHQLGLYFTLPHFNAGEEAEHGTFVHSKLMIVDDLFLTVGSANLTNRSMAVDTELNASVESAQPDDSLSLAIRKARATLLAEHTGGPEIAKVRGLVAQLDQLAERGAAGDRTEPCRLRLHPSPTVQESAALLLIDPRQLPFDPDESDLPSHDSD